VAHRGHVIAGKPDRVIDAAQGLKIMYAFVAYLAGLDRAKTSKGPLRSRLV